MEIVIRAIERDDMPIVVNLLKEELSPFSPDCERFDIIWEKYKSQGNVIGLVACLSEDIVGYGSIVLETKIRGGTLAHVEDICVSSRCRNIGVASRIMQTLLEFAQSNECYKITLSCKPANVAFYRARGYESDGESMVRFIE